MGGPIVRTGTTPKFWTNWENIFGDKKKSGKKAAAKSTKKAAKTTKKKTAKKSAKKAKK
jgi:hypothetical protein